MKTIKQLADELGVSKTAVRKYMDEAFREQYTEITNGNIIHINDEGCKIIAESLRKPQETIANKFVETTTNTSLREEIAFLRGQLEAKDRQLEAKDLQIEKLQEQNSQLTEAMQNTTDSLKAAQALHAGTMKGKLLEAPKKHKWQFWKKNEDSAE